MQSIAIVNNNNSIQLKFQVNGYRYAFNPVKRGKFTSTDDIAKAEAIATQIKIDIELNKFDATLEAYKPKSFEEITIAIKDAQTSLANIKHRKVCIIGLWGKYVEYKRPSVSPSTYKIDYVRRVGNALKQLPTTDVYEAIAIRDWLIAHKPPMAVKKILTQLSACCAWAKDSKLIAVNPFDGMAAKIKQLNRSEDDDINPFTAVERDLIIKAFYAHNIYKHYAPLVDFIFNVGCRPSEAIALTWGDIAKGDIAFQNAFVEKEVQERLKTQSKRVIAMNRKVARLIDEIKPEAIAKSALVFPSPDGLHIDWHNFCNRAWKRILQSLPDIEYRNPYQMRHTFITLAIKNGVTLTDIAKNCGNSPKMILDRYSGVTRDFVMPEF